MQTINFASKSVEEDGKTDHEDLMMNTTYARGQRSDAVARIHFAVIRFSIFAYYFFNVAF